MSRYLFRLHREKKGGKSDREQTGMRENTTQRSDGDIQKRDPGKALKKRCCRPVVKQF